VSYTVKFDSFDDASVVAQKSNLQLTRVHIQGQDAFLLAILDSEIVITNSTFSNEDATKTLLKLSASRLKIQEDSFFINFSNAKGDSFPLIDISQGSEIQAKDMYISDLVNVNFFISFNSRFQI